MGDEDDIRLVAEDNIRTRGLHAVAWLTEQAELADAIADSDSAKTWREIAAAADGILRAIRADQLER